MAHLHSTTREREKCKMIYVHEKNLPTTVNIIISRCYLNGLESVLLLLVPVRGVLENHLQMVNKPNPTTLTSHYCTMEGANLSFSLKAEIKSVLSNSGYISMTGHVSTPSSDMWTRAPDGCGVFRLILWRSSPSSPSPSNLIPLHWRETHRMRLRHMSHVVSESPWWLGSVQGL